MAEYGGKKMFDQRYDIYVGNIPSNFDELKLLQLFQAYRILGIRNFTKNGHKVFGFLRCTDEKEVERIVREMHNITVDGRSLILRPADEDLYKKLGGNTTSATKFEQRSNGFASQEKQPDSRRPPLRLPYGYGSKPNMTGVRERLQNGGPPPLVLCEERLPEQLVLPLGHASPRISPSGTSSSNASAATSRFAARNYGLEAASQQLYTRVNPAIQCGYHVPYTACHEPSVLTVSPVSSQCSHHTSHNHHHEPISCCSVNECHSTARTSSTCHSSPPISDRHSQTKRSNGRVQQQKKVYQPADYDDNDSPGESVVLCVANFPFYTSRDKLFALFEDFDPLDIDMVENEPMDNPEDFTYALVTMPDKETAEAAIFELDNTQFGRRTLIVQELLHHDLTFDYDITEDYQSHSASKKTRTTLSERFARISLS